MSGAAAASGQDPASLVRVRLLRHEHAVSVAKSPPIHFYRFLQHFTPMYDNFLVVVEVAVL